MRLQMGYARMNILIITTITYDKTHTHTLITKCGLSNFRDDAEETSKEIKHLIQTH